MSWRRPLSGEAQEVALAEAQAVRAMAARGAARAARRAGRRGRRRRGRGRRRASARASCSSSGCRAAASARSTAPAASRPRSRLYRRLPRGARARRERPRGDGGASRARRPRARLGPARARSARARSRSRSRPASSSSASASTARARASRAWRLSGGRSATTWPASTSTGRSCLVVGGGTVGLEKAKGLLDCGAVVTVVAPQIEPELQQLPVRWRRKRYETEDLAGNTLVVAATPLRSVNHRIFRDAEERSMLVNVVDTPELCSFILPAVYRRDPIALAVSTGGASPALAKRLRDELGARIGDEHVALARATARPPALGEAPLPLVRRAQGVLRVARRGVAAVTVFLVGAGPGRPRPDHGARAGADSRLRRPRPRPAGRRRSSSPRLPTTRSASAASGSSRTRSTACSCSTADAA